jgi:hypothetical protein
MFEGDEKVRTQSALLFPHGIEIAALEEARKESLSQVLSFFAMEGVSPDKSKKRAPIFAAKRFQSGIGRRGRTLGGKNDTPLRRDKSGG